MMKNNGSRGQVALGAMALAIAMLSGCATPPAPEAATPPAWLFEPRGCAIVAGGAVGSTFDDPKAGRVYFEVNRQVGAYIQEGLAGVGYRVVNLTVPPGSGGADDQILRAMVQNRCSRVLQVALVVKEDAQGPFFRFDVDLMRLQSSDKPGAVPVNGVSVVPVREYGKSYRYARTKEVFDTFYTGEFAGKVADELAASGRAEVLKPAPKR